MNDKNLYNGIIKKEKGKNYTVDLYKGVWGDKKFAENEKKNEEIVKHKNDSKSYQLKKSAFLEFII